jgi:predicted small secreted protein
MKKALAYTAGLVAAYLVLANYTGFGKDLSAASSAYNTGVKTLQGR